MAIDQAYPIPPAIDAFLARAQQLMRSSALNIMQTAIACRFSTPSHFPRVFRALTSSTASPWRQSYTNRREAE